MEYTQSAGAITLPPGIANTSKSNFEPARCQPFAARAATDSNIAFIPFSSPQAASATYASATYAWATINPKKR
jgi:hypothetical protein